MRVGWIIEMRRRGNERIFPLLSATRTGGPPESTVVFTTEESANAIASSILRKAGAWLDLVRVAEVRTVEVAPGLFVVVQVHPSPEDVH